MSDSHGSYFVPNDTGWWPIVGSVGLAGLAVGFSNVLNGSSGMGTFLMYIGLAVTVVMFFGWFGIVIKESRSGLYNGQVDTSFRMGMFWFIFSEVMFFAAFFGALFYARNLSLPWVAGEGAGIATNQFLWPNFEMEWPSNGPANMGGDFTSMGALGIPAINTALLLTSGITITWAHHALLANKRMQLIIGMFLTVLLGAVFLGFQAYEYSHAYSELDLTLKSGIYGTTFYMLTGFHGMHVTVGAIMLSVILVRCIKGHFSPEQHFGFEAVAWYWHFVDVVWLGLYLFVYWF